MKNMIYSLRTILTAFFMLLASMVLLSQASVDMTWTPGSWSSEPGFELIEVATGTVYYCEEAGFPATTPAGVTNLNLPYGDYEVRGFDSFGDGWNGGTLSFDYAGITVFTTTGPPNVGFSPSNNTCDGNASPVTDPSAAILGTFTIAPITCQITCPADITVDNDPGSCDAFVNVPLPQTSQCAGPATNDFNGTDNASDTYPIGPTTVTWTAMDVAGYPISCEMTITVNNTEAVELNCPADVEVTLDPGDCEAYPLWDTPIAFSCNGFGAPPATVSTINSGGNGNASGGMVYFDVTNNFNIDMDIVEMSANISGATMIEIYLLPGGSYVGNTGNPGAWTLVYTADATTGPFSGPFPGNGTLTPFTTDFSIPPGTSGLALHMLSASSNYTNGNGGNQFYSDGNLDIQLGASSNFAWDATPFSPRVWNGSITYATLENTTEATQTGGPASGDPFPIGSTTITYEATDVAGNTATCSFNVVVHNYPNPTSTLACNDEVQISLDENCEAVVNADMILEGGPYSCYNDYSVEIFSQMPSDFAGAVGDVQQPLEGPGSYWVGVYNAAGNNCWGHITVLDKLPPNLECRDVTVSCVDGPESVTEPAPAMVGYQTKVYDDLNDVVDNNSFDYTFDFSSIPAGTPVLDLNVRFKLSHHTWLPDLNVVVTAPDGTQGSIFTIGGCIFQEWPIDLTLDDDGAIITLCSDLDAGGAPIAPFQGGVAMPALLTFFEGLDASGVWTVTVSDNFPADDGIIEIVGLSIDVNAPQVLAQDACGPIELTYTDNSTFHYCETIAQEVERVWTAVDASGNQAQCVQHINVESPDINDFFWPLNWDDLPGNNPMLECNSGYPVDALGHPHPDFTGWPADHNDYCGTFEMFYSDVVYNLECGKKIIRHWTVVNDCSGEIFEYPQLIRITDKTAPTFMAPDDITAKTKAYVCNTDVEVPAIMHLQDNCDAYPRWWVTVNGGTLVGDNNFNGYVDINETWYILGLAIGDYQLCYHAVDNCGNEAVQCININVFDGVPPIPVCEQYKQVSLTAMGNAKVWAWDFDSGSFDNCNPVYFKVLRVDSNLVYDGGCPDLNGDDNPITSSNDVWYDDDVFFCCEDQNNEVMVSMRVFDVNPGPGPVAPRRMLPGGDLYGHFNDCWSIVKVECKIPPALDCPDLVVTCEESLDPNENPRLWPNVISVCGAELDYSDRRDMGICGANIVRTWTATGCDKATQCKQKITVEATEPFDPCTIQMPRDVKAHCRNELADGGEPTWDENPCNVVTAEIINEDTFTFVDGACYKIVREWAVIDWCVYEPNTGAEDDVDVWRSNRKLDCNNPHYANGYDGYYTYTQILMVVDFIPPTISLEDQCVATTDCYAYDVEMTASATDSCNVDEKFWWKYIVTNMDTWETVQYSYNYTPRPDQGRKGSRSKDNLDNTANAKLVILDPLPKGNYRVSWTVGDGCGNANSMNQYFTVADKKAPTPVMVDIATANMENGMVELKARTFDKGGCDFGCLSSFDNCTPKSGLFFTFTDHIPHLWDQPQKWVNQFNKYGRNFFDPATGNISTEDKYFNGEADAWLPGQRTAQRAFLCDYVEENNSTITIQVYVWDEFAYNEECNDGNYDFANVLLNINHADCPGGTSRLVSGLIINAESGMEMTADDGENKSTVFSTTDGYAFNTLSTIENYDISGKFDGDYLNGVTTLDLVIIQKYLLGLKEINDPLRLIAADANNNGDIAASDLLEIRKAILGMSDKFTNDSWVAISTDYTFVDASNAAAEAQNARVRHIEAGDQNITDANFVAVKIGDLNGSANALESRNSSNISMMLDDANVTKGQVIEVPFYASDFNNVYGAQFTMNVSGMEVEGITSGALQVNENNINVVNSNVVFSWNNANGVNVNDGEVLFTLTLKANANTRLSSVLNLNDNVARTEAYTGSDLEINNINLEYRNSAVSYALYQNEPNPFTEETVIGFDLPEAGTYTMTVYDVTGKELVVRTAEGTAGYNTVKLSKKDLNVSGVLYYRLESGDYTATKKMIVLK